MSNLLLQPDLSGNGPIHDVTPASAGWSHVGFGLHDITAGGSVESGGTGDEICLVLLSGSARIIAGDLDTGMLQGRASVFDKVAPQAVYVPMKTAWRVEAGSDSELAVCRAPGTEGKLPPRLIGSQNMPLETRGTGSNVRHVCNIRMLQTWRTFDPVPRVSSGMFCDPIRRGGSLPSVPGARQTASSESLPASTRHAVFIGT